MMKPGLCCDECFDLLAKRSTVAAKLWLDLCEIQEKCRIFGLRIEESAHLQLLEHLGFIITTDAEGLTVIKVFGKEEDSLGNFFCGGKCGR